MKKALIFHGTHGSPQGNWFPWLKEHLIIQGWDVVIPSLPTPEDQSLESWITALNTQVTNLSDINMVIGHSLGATFILRLIERNLINPSQILLVSTVINFIQNEEYDRLNKSFIDHPFDWKKIKATPANWALLHGDNDPYVQLNQPQEVAENLNISLNLIKGGGHINADAGYTEFPEILDFIND
jgi:predicted alpha/beta hydrolase family esterase